MIKPIIYFDDILHETVWFYCGCELMEVKLDILKEKDVNVEFEVEHDLDALGNCFQVPVEGQTLYIVHVRRKKDYVTLGHELVHFICNLFKNNNVPINFDNQEMFAKYHSFYMEKFKKALR